MHGPTGLTYALLCDTKTVTIGGQKKIRKSNTAKKKRNILDSYNRFGNRVENFLFLYTFFHFYL